MTETVLSEAVKQEIDKWIAKYPPEHKESAVLSALTIVQEGHGGCLSESLMDAVAEYLEMPKIAVYEVATFYSMFNLQVVGKHIIDVCTNISCQLCGSEKIVWQIQKRTGIKMGETSKDGKYTLRGVECLAACINAPMMIVDGQYHENLTEEKVDKILDDLN